MHNPKIDCDTCAVGVEPFTAVDNLILCHRCYKTFSQFFSPAKSELGKTAPTACPEAKQVGAAHSRPALKYSITFLVAAAMLIQFTSSSVAFVASAEGPVVMRSVFEEASGKETKTERTIVQGDARLCSPIFGRVCKAIWPTKTAEQLAALVGCSVRAAAYEISGEREPSAHSLRVVFNEMIPPRG